MSNEVSETSVAAEDLKQYIERIEKLLDEKKAIMDDVKDVYAELKSTGFDGKAVRALIRLRSMNPDDRNHQDAILELYKQAIGMD